MSKVFSYKFSKLSTKMRSCPRCCFFKMNFKDIFRKIGLYIGIMIDKQQQTSFVFACRYIGMLFNLKVLRMNLAPDLSSCVVSFNKTLSSNSTSQVVLRLYKIRFSEKITVREHVFSCTWHVTLKTTKKIRRIFP